MSIPTTVTPHAELTARAAGSPIALRAAAVVGFALLTALAAQVAFPIPGTPVPVTLQTLAVTLAAVTLGPRFGALSMALYLALGLLGAPVFADASSGPSILFGATGGYLLAFLLVPPLTAFALRSNDTNAATGWRGVLAQVILANLVIFTLGVAWLAVFADLTLSDALTKGLYPFLPGTIIKSAIALGLGTAIAPWAIKRLW